MEQGKENQRAIRSRDSHRQQMPRNKSFIQFAGEKIMQEGEITLKKEKTTPAAQPTEKLEAPFSLDARAQPKLSGGSARMRDP